MPSTSEPRRISRASPGSTTVESLQPLVGLHWARWRASPSHAQPTAAAAAVLWVVVLPFARRSLRDSRHFVRALSTGQTTESRARELFGPRYRVRTLGVLAVGAFFTVSVAGTQAWIIYHPVRNLGMEQWAATTVMICGGAFSLLGFPIGGRLAEVWGRRATFSVAGLAYVVAALGFYRGYRRLSRPA